MGHLGMETAACSGGRPQNMSPWEPFAVDGSLLTPGVLMVQITEDRGRRGSAVWASLVASTTK